MKNKWLAFGASVFGVVVLGVVTFSLLNRPVTLVQNNQTACPGGAVTIFIPAAPSGSTATILGGQITLQANITISSMLPRKVEFFSNSTFIGRGNPASQTLWTTTWFSPLSPNGPQNIYAVAYMQDGVVCQSNTQTIQVYNSTTPGQFSFELITSPASWQGSVNTRIIFVTAINVKNGSGMVIFDAKPFSDLDTVATIGVVEDDTISNFAYFSGPSQGDGYVDVTAKYAGRISTRKIPVRVYSTSTTSYPLPLGDAAEATNTEGGTSSGNTTPENNNQQTPTTDPALSSQGDIELASCINRVLPPERAQAILTGGQRPTFQELTVIKECLTRLRYVMPPALSPIEPSKISELGRSEKHTISEVINQPVAADSSKKAIVFRGSSDPNSTVIIYVFSEPLVLLTEADDSGQWSYSLEDPLEAGDHEAYVVVEKGGEYQRSDPFPFSVAQAQASEGNPDGLSLELAGDIAQITPSRSTPILLYVSIVAVIVVGAVIALLLLTRRALRKEARGSIIEHGELTTPPSEIISTTDNDSDSTAMHEHEERENKQDDNGLQR